jgi:ectoine hydroxylase-related dioxygenase (phytanoyl-CoA dioxygenase family)
MDIRAVEVDDERFNESANSAIERIREVGFCVVKSVISAQHSAEIRAVLASLLRAERKQNLHPSGHQRIVHLLVKHPIFTGLLCNPFVLAVWRRYLGNDMVCSTMTANALWPRSSEQYWHVDHPYWTMHQPYAIYPLSGQAIWMIDGFTVANGATAGIVGSHRRPHLPDMAENWCEEATILTGPPGSVILADGAWWHTSRPNVSRRTRFGVLTTFIRSYCVTQEDMPLQLAAMKNPSAEVTHLLGGNRYIPSRGFPY